MKRLVQVGIVILLAIVIAYLHPFQLAMPWQSGRPGPLEITMHRIMAGDQYDLVESDWGRTTPLNYVAVTGQFRAVGATASTCTDLRLALDDWGRVSEITRHNDGCEIEARGPGPMTATIDVTEDPESRRSLRIEIRVQHSS
jgi:hypothetical protein